jgi:hypothetical protein
MSNPRQWEHTEGEYRTRADEALAIGTVEIIKADLRRLWSAGMRVEQMGIRNPDGRVDVEAEIESLYHYTMMQSFYDNTPYDLLNRKRFLADFVKPYYTNWGLNRAIIPNDSYVKDILQRSSLLYKTPALRTIVDETTNANYHMILRNSAINSKSKTWHRMIKLHDLVAVRPVVRARNGKYILTYDVKTPAEFRVVLDDYNEVEKMMYVSQRVKDGVREDVIVVWTATQHYIVDVHGERSAVVGNPQMVNPYNRIPFIFMSLTDDSVFYSGGQYGLVYSNLLHNFYELLTNSDANASALNVFVGRNLGGALGNDPFIRPGDVLNIESNDSLSDGKSVEAQFVSAELFADRLRELQTAVFKQSAIRRGIPPSFLADTVQELSGKALRSSYRALLEEKQDDADTIRDYERELAILTAQVSNYHTAQTRYPKLDVAKIEEGFYADFSEQDFSGDDPNLEFDLEMAQVEKGIISLTSVIRKHNPDISTDEGAMLFYEANKATLDKYTKKGFSTTITQPAPSVDNTLGAE